MLKKYKLKRKKYSTTSTLGIWYDSYDKELCRTLENPWRNNLRSVSCIPEGTYICKKFSGSKYKDVWELQDVAGRSAILIHNGNIEEHTHGCILVGQRWGFIGDEEAVLASKNTLDKLRQILPNEFELEIVRSDHETESSRR